ncbi:MAG: GAF domain-containing protein, partial [Chloroflexi bacterium]|nr:GAF domain-containing protein [Chloroflexota bacterium]
MSAITSPSSTQILNAAVEERRVVDQAGQLTLAVSLILTSLVLIFAPIVTLFWLNVPFIGAFVEMHNYVNVEDGSLVGNTWTGPVGGLLQGDRIDTVTAIGGFQTNTPVDSGPDLTQILRRNEVAPGEILELQVTRAATGEQAIVAVELMTMPLGDVLTLFGIPYVVGLAYIGIGLWVYRVRRDQTVARIFLLLCLVAAAISILTFDMWTTQILARLGFALFPILGGLILAMSLYYPNEAQMVARHPVRRWYALIPVLAVLIWGQWQMGRSFMAFSTVNTVNLIFVATCFAVFVGALGVRGLTALAPTVREQSWVVLLGSIIALLPFLADALGLLSIPPSYTIAALLLFPVVIAYTITQYSVIDTTRVVTTAATYTVIGVVVVIGYALVVAGATQVLTWILLNTSAGPPGLDPASAEGLQQINLTINSVLVGILAFTLVVVFQPLRQTLQSGLDRLFFQTRAEFEERLTDFRHDLTLAEGLGEVTRLLKQQVRETLMPTHIYIFLRDPQTNDFVAVGEGSRPDTDIKFDMQSGLVHALSTTADVIFLELNKPLPPELVEEHARLAVLRTPILAPLQGQHRLAGWVSIGNKRSGDPFTIHDLRFIQALTEQASLAVERAQVIADLERRVRELDVLGQVSQAVNFSTDPDVLMELLYTQTGKLIDTTNFYIILHQSINRAMAYAFFVEGDERYADRENRLMADYLGLESEVIRTGRPIRTDNYLSECSQRGVEALSDPPNAWMGVPLRAGNRTLGLLAVSSYIQGVMFTDDQLKVFWSIADQAATALDKSRLFRETEQRALQLATLNNIGKELVSTLDLESLLRRIMTSAVDILNAEAGSLFLIDENTGELVFRVVEGPAQNLVGKRIPPGSGIVGEAAAKKEPVISNQAAADPRHFSDVDQATRFSTESLLAVPLILQDESIGVLEVINKKDGTPFVEDDISLLTTFSSQASIAIQNARLYQATDAELALRVDELQNLQRIDRELNRTLDLDRVINITLDWALRTTGASAGCIGLVSPERTGINIRAWNGYNKDFGERIENGLILLD